MTPTNEIGLVAFSHLLLEDGSDLLMEDGHGFLLLEIDPPDTAWTGNVPPDTAWTASESMPPGTTWTWLSYRAPGH
jgi:hypothetical protein